jgi:hypothetical protein
MEETMETIELEAMDELITNIQSEAKALVEKSKGIQAIKCNADRILASSKMLELNLVDLVDK